jgi:hypothetical protein
MRTDLWMLLLCACSSGKDLVTTLTDTSADADTDADSDTDADTDSDTDTDTDADTDTGTPIPWLLPICPVYAPDDPVLVFDPVTQIAVQGDALLASFGYSCGCANHVVGSCFGEAFSADAVPVLDIFVLHEANNDPCGASCDDGVAVDLLQVQSQYTQTFGSATGAVDLEIHWLEPSGPRQIVVPYAW